MSCAKRSGSSSGNSEPMLIWVRSRSSTWGGGAGEAVADRGSGTARAAKGGSASVRRHPPDLALCGVELEVEDDGEEVVRVSEGVRVRDSGRRKEMLRSLSNGDGTLGSSAWTSFLEC